MSFKSKLYRALPSLNSWWHGKRRKGLEHLFGGKGILVCQEEQDRIFTQNLWKGEKAGFFWEVGCGDGTTGSCTLHLERAGWRGLLWEKMDLPRRTAQARRSSPVLGGDPAELRRQGPGPDFLAIRRPGEFPWIWSWLDTGDIRPRWVGVENARAEVDWAQRLEPRGFRLRWFFHDDEYYLLERT